jgi:hypothetical protein
MHYILACVNVPKDTSPWATIPEIGRPPCWLAVASVMRKKKFYNIDNRKRKWRESGATSGRPELCPAHSSRPWCRKHFIWNINICWIQGSKSEHQNIFHDKFWGKVKLYLILPIWCQNCKQTGEINLRIWTIKMHHRSFMMTVDTC